MFLRQRTFVNADVHCDGWTHIFGGKASETETSRLVEKKFFYLLYLILHLASPEFCRDILHPIAIVFRCLRDPVFSRFGIVTGCDGQTDGHTTTADTALA